MRRLTEEQLAIWRAQVETIKNANVYSDGFLQYSVSAWKETIPALIAEVEQLHADLTVAEQRRRELLAIVPADLAAANTRIKELEAQYELVCRENIALHAQIDDREKTLADMRKSWAEGLVKLLPPDEKAQKLIAITAERNQLRAELAAMPMDAIRTLAYETISTKGGEYLIALGEVADWLLELHKRKMEEKPPFNPDFEDPRNEDAVWGKDQTP